MTHKMYLPLKTYFCVSISPIEISCNKLLMSVNLGMFAYLAFIIFVNDGLEIMPLIWDELNKIPLSILCHYCLLNYFTILPALLLWRFIKFRSSPVFLRLFLSGPSINLLAKLTPYLKLSLKISNLFTSKCSK